MKRWSTGELIVEGDVTLRHHNGDSSEGASDDIETTIETKGVRCEACFSRTYNSIFLSEENVYYNIAQTTAMTAENYTNHQYRYLVYCALSKILCAA